MKSILSLITFCFMSILGFSQEISDDYLGEYKGELQIFSKGNTNTVEMEFKLKPTDTPSVYDYILIYHSQNGTDIREYVLKQKDSTGNYLLDENNGIVLSTKYINNSLHSFFKVQNSLLKSSIRFGKNYAEFEIVMANTSQVDTTATADKSFEVFAYPIATYQFARLEKLK